MENTFQQFFSPLLICRQRSLKSKGKVKRSNKISDKFYLSI